jgi:excisionase family DNA binding protein
MNKSSAIPEKAGWRVNEWAASAGISRSSVYELIADNRIASVRFGGARIITTAPQVFLASLVGKAA